MSGRASTRNVHLETERLVLRDVRETDLGPLAECGANPDVARWLPFGANPEERYGDLLRKSIANQREECRKQFGLAFELKETGRLVGSGGTRFLNYDDREVNVGYLIHRDHWGQGYATEAATRLVQFSFEELKAHRVVGSTAPENVRSLAVLERLGMQREGVLRKNMLLHGEWCDSVLYSILEQEWRAREHGREAPGKTEAPGTDNPGEADTDSSGPDGDVSRHNSSAKVAIETKRLRLREFLPDDWRNTHALFNDSRVCKHIPIGPQTEHESRAFAQKMIANSHQSPRISFGLVLTLKKDGRFAGMCGMRRTNPEMREMSIAYILGSRYWGRGFATETARALLQYEFEELEVHRAFADVDPENTGSVRVLKNLGMQREARLRDYTCIRGEWRDWDLYSILEDEWLAGWR